MTIHTSRGHRVHVLEGDAAGVSARGREIQNLGDQMAGAAGVLRAIADGATEEKGRSIERIRDEVGDTYNELELAGQRYKPTGKAMEEYGAALGPVQAALRTLVQDIEAAHSTAQSKQQAAQQAQASAHQTADYDPTDTAAKTAHDNAHSAAANAQSEATTAQRHLDELLSEFDRHWDTWDEAYELALGRINDATTGNVTDDWTDNLAGVAQIVVDVLTVVGFVVALAAIVIGGPVFLILGAVVGTIALVATAFLYFKGRASLGDVIWSVIGVLPFGKLGSLFKNGQRMKALQIFKGPFADIGEGISSLRSVRGVVNDIASQTGNGLGRVARAGLASRVADTFAGTRWGDLFSRTTAWNNLSRGGLGSWGANTLNDLAQFTSHHQNVVRTVAGADSILDDLASLGNQNRRQQVVNILDVSVRNGKAGVDATGVVYDMFAGNSELDTWRGELAASR